MCLALAAVGRTNVTLVEGDAVSSGARTMADATAIVDPPRTGLSREAVTALIASAPAAIVYVSCDVATLARDARVLIDAGYELGEVSAFDLFSNTAHVESLAVLQPIVEPPFGCRREGPGARKMEPATRVTRSCMPVLQGSCIRPTTMASSSAETL